ncbi:sugar phosphate nucleotidyltransferase [Xanthobacter sp. DSM 14517]
MPRITWCRTRPHRDVRHLAHRATTSYGYIRLGSELDPLGAYEVDSFVEKPDRATAEHYVQAGYLWNSGNFLFPAGLLLEETERYEPAISSAVVAAVANAKVDLIGFLRLDPAAFKSAPAKSIDFAVMGRTRLAAVVGGSFGWSDVGAWDALHEIGSQDENGNVAVGAVQCWTAPVPMFGRTAPSSPPSGSTASR